MTQKFILSPHGAHVTTISYTYKDNQHYSYIFLDWYLTVADQLPPVIILNLTEGEDQVKRIPFGTSYDYILRQYSRSESVRTTCY